MTRERICGRTDPHPFGECADYAEARCEYAGCLGPADGSECRHPGPDDEPACDAWDAGECAMFRERSVAGTSDRIPDCPVHGRHPDEPGPDEARCPDCGEIDAARLIANGFHRLDCLANDRGREAYRDQVAAGVGGLL